MTWRHGAAEEEKGKFALIPLGPSGIIIKTSVSTTLYHPLITAPEL